jgi:sec-independent protein translocase protein TatA
MIGTVELILILGIAVILFGPEKLPELSRSLAKSIKEFRKAVDELEGDELSG